MKTKIIFLIILLASLTFSIIRNAYILNDVNFKYRISPSSLLKGVTISKDNNFEKLLKGQKESFEFQSRENNLGAVEFLFNNHSRINQDKLVFRIKDNSSGDWYYQGTYDTSLMDAGQFFPFGFPIISNSKGHQYIVEIESLNGTDDSSVSLSKNALFYLLDYSFSSQYLKAHPTKIPAFIFSKMSMYLNLLTNKDHLSLISPFLISTISLSVIFGIYFLLPTRTKKQITNINKSQIKSLLTKNKYIIILLTVYAATHIKFLTYSQYWDANIYWHLFIQGIQGATNLTSIIINFNFLGHPSMGYIGLMAISQFGGVGNVFLFNTENMLLAMIAIAAFYKILSFFFPKNDTENIIVTGIFAFNPLFYATSISFNLDFPVLVFTTLMIAALVYKKTIWYVISALLLIFSKETGTLIYIAFVSFYFLLFSFKRWVINYRKINLGETLKFTLPLIIFAVYEWYSKGNIWMANTLSNSGNKFSFVWNDNGFATFGVNSVNILSRFFEIFVLNFTWVMTAVIILAVIKAVIFDTNIIKNFESKKKDIIRILVAVFGVFVFFNFIFIIIQFSRYVVESVVFIVFIFYLSLNFLNLGKKVTRGFLLIVLFLVFIQTFKAIDPSPQIIFGTRYWGNNVSSPFFGFADGTVYNSQFTFIDEFADLINKNTSGYNLIRDNFDDYFFKNVSFFGKVDDLKQIKKLGKSNLMYVYIPWFANVDNSLDKIKVYYRVTYYKTLDYRGYYAKLYTLEPI